MARENKTARVTGDRVEHIDNVKKEEGVGGGAAVGLQVGNVRFNSSAGKVDNGIKATRDTDTKLALWEEVGGEVGGGVLEYSRGKKAAPGETDAERAEFSKVGGVFIEGSKVVGAEGSGKGGGKVSKGKVALEGGVGIKVGAHGGGSGIGGIRGGFKKAQVANGVGVISKRAGGSEFANGAEASKKVGVGEVERGGRGGGGLGASTARSRAMRWKTGRVEAGNDGLVGRGHGGRGHGLEEAEAGGMILIMVGKVLGVTGSSRVKRGE